MSGQLWYLLCHIFSFIYFCKTGIDTILQIKILRTGETKELENKLINRTKGFDHLPGRYLSGHCVCYTHSLSHCPQGASQLTPDIGFCR